MAPATVQPSAPTSADADTALPAAESGPKSLGDYELLEKIGEGGMGIIYRARHRRIRHIVALKVMRPQIAGDPDQVKRFEREVRAQARLQHRHIVKIYDIKLDGDQPYYTMALVVGGSLDKRRQEFAEPTKAAELVRKIALAIEHAHSDEQHICHRDLKPANILLDSDDEPLVSDFGLAKPAEDDLEVTRPGVLVGTPPYMAPELFCSDPRQSQAERERSADIWALGVILYQLLSDKRPFEGRNLDEVRVSVQTAEPPRLRGGACRIDRFLEAIVFGCLEKEPSVRYASAGKLADDLGKWITGKIPSVRPARLPSRILRRVQRRPRTALVTMAILLATIAGMIGAYFRHPDRALDKSVAELRAGKPVTLIAQSGSPAWSRWVGSRGSLSRVPVAPGVKEESFAIQGWDASFLELMPHMPIGSYSFSADVCHWSGGTADGEVGIYLGHVQNELSHVFWALTFDEVSSKTSKDAAPRPRDSLVDFGFRILQKGDHANCSRQYILARPFQATGAEGKRWRSLRIDVTPDAIEICWEGEIIAHISASKRQREWLGLLKNLAPTQALKNDFATEGGLGLYVIKGEAAFRNVVVEPLASRPLSGH
jgi:serine/threonine-protein kinase